MNLEIQKMPEKLSQKVANMSILAMFFVVVLHWGVPQDVGTPVWWMSQIVKSIANIAVPYFFLISGFFLARHTVERGWWFREMRKRVRSLLVPYLTWSGLYFIFISVLCLRSAVASGQVAVFCKESIIRIPLVLGLVPDLPPLCSPHWYLRCLFLLVFISPFLLCLLRKCGFWGLFVIGMFVGVYDLDWYALEPGPSRTFFFLVKPYAVLYYSVGMYLAYQPIRLQRKKSWAILLLLLGLALVWGRTALLAHGVMPHSLIATLSVPMLMFAIWTFLGDGAWPMWLTGNSFAVYLVHPFVMAGASAVMKTQNGIMLPIKAILVFSLTIGIVVLWRRVTPHMAAFMFGGR